MSETKGTYKGWWIGKSFSLAKSLAAKKKELDKANAEIETQAAQIKELEQRIVDITQIVSQELNIHWINKQLKALEKARKDK